MKPDSGSMSKTTIWLGRGISGLCVLFFVFDGVTKLMQTRLVMESQALLGYPDNLTSPIGTTALVCAILYAIPRTSVLGAILLTGFLGGATASMLRIGNPAHPFLFPVFFGALVWLGLYLRNERLRTLIPWTR